MAYIVWDFRPEIFGDLTFLRWYGLCWLVGMVAAYRIMRSFDRPEGLSVEELDTLAMYMVLGVIIGARLGHVLFYDPVYYWHNPVAILPFQFYPEFAFTGLLGLASHGGVLGALVAMYLYERRFHRGYLWLLDRITIAGAALGGFIRIGNLMNSEIIGVPSDQPWAFVFTRLDGIPRHPAQVYEAIFCFVVSAGLFYVLKAGETHKRSGFVAGLGIVLIFTQRFLIEFLKENQVAFESTLVFNMGQWLSIPLILAGLGLVVWSSRVTKATNNQH